MRRWIVICLLSLPAAVTAQEVHCDSLDRNGDTLFLPGTQTPYSGTCWQKLPLLEQGQASPAWTVYFDYQDGRLHGNARIYYASGQVMSVRGYHAGQAHGKWETYYENGSLISRSNFCMGIQCGWTNFWYRDGTLQQKSLYEDGALKLELTYNTDGSLKDSTISMTDGLTRYHSLYRNGNMSSQEWLRNGIRDSTCTYWYEDGTLKATMSYRNGAQQDTSWFYHKDGWLESVGIYSGDEKADVYVFYDRKGEVTEKIIRLDERLFRIEVYRKGILRKTEITEM